jgi:hypothetical protein
LWILFTTVVIHVAVDIALAREKEMSGEVDTARTMFSFENKAEIDRWIAVNDNVMGGLSEGEAS